MNGLRKRYWYNLALCASSLSLIYSPIAYTAELLAEAEELSPTPANQNAYTINFNNVSIIELIRFTSKISGLNFVFEEADLQFSVTVVSEEAVSAQGMLAALSQVLRMHDLTLLEQDNNVLITNSRKINQIPKIVSADLPSSGSSRSALVTRVFRIKNANVNSVANIIRPMISDTALIEVSAETRQLIVTDITTNVDQIAALLTSLDAPHTSLDVDVYTVKNVPPMTLIPLIEQLLAPFKEGNPFVLVPQPETQSIYIVSTPYLIERTLSLMEDLDVPATAAPTTLAGAQGSKSSFFVYHPQYRSGELIEQELRSLSLSLTESGLADPGFLSALNSMKWTARTNSLVFTGDPQSIQKIQEILATLDTAEAGQSKTSFFVYHPLHRSGEELQQAVQHLAANLTESGLADPNFLAALESMKWTPTTNSLVFTGNPQAIQKVQEMLATLDVSTEIAPGSSGFFLYKLQYIHCEALFSQLTQLGEKIPPTSLQNQQLIEAIKQIKCVPASNSLLISGSPSAVAQIKAIVAEFDTKEGGLLSGDESFFIYRPKYLSGEEIKTALSSLVQDAQGTGLNNPALLKTIHSARFVEETNTLIFIGTPVTIEHLEQLLASIDTGDAEGSIKEIGNIDFFLYKVQATPGNQLLASLKQFTLQLDQTTSANKELISAIDSAKWIEESNTLLFTANQRTLATLENLVKKFDVPGGAMGMASAARNATNFVIYNPRYLKGEELITILQDFMQNLQQSGVNDPHLFDVITNLKWISKTSSLLISGDSAAIAQVQQLLVKFDVPNKEGSIPTIESIDNTSFLVYKLQYHPGNDIQSALKQVAMSLEKNSTSPPELVDAINSLQWIQVTNSILCTGHQDVLVRLKDLIQNLDIPLRQVFIEVLIINTTLHNQQNFGLQWGGQVKYLNKTIMQSGNFPQPASSGSQMPTTLFPTNLQGINGSTFPTNQSIPFTTGFDLGVIGDIIMHKGKSFISLGSLLNALQLDTDSSVVLNPKIITQDNRQSTVFVGQNIPFAGSIVTNTGGSATVQNSNIEYRDIGVSLTITPLLGEGDVVTMDIVQDISQVVQGTNVNTNNTQLTGIQTNHSHMETRVHVPNNHFVALSGMINDTKTHYKTGIPCLGGLPVIGAFFSETDRSAQKNNIIVFVRPQIVTTYQDFKAITEHQEWLYKDVARLPVLKEEFDEGIDLVKLPENE